MKAILSIMKNDFLNFLSALGIGYKYALNGIVGGFVWSLHNGSKFWEGLRQIIVGGLVAGYATPVIAERMNMNYTGFLSFVIGIIGMAVVDSIYKWTVRKVKLLF
jgi:hypothetical protein